MTDRRSTYFIFQALLTIVLLLFFLYRHEFVLQWPLRLTGLSIAMVGILIFIARAPASWLARQRLLGAWFLCDVLLSSLTLYWAHQPGSDLYVTYFLVIFGTALTENVAHSFLVALVATLLYGYSAISNNRSLPSDPEFWLRLPYLWIFASFTALLSRDSREARQRQETLYRERTFHMERLAALGQISAEVAHRIKAPLTTIRVNAEVLGHQPTMSPAMKKELHQIEHEVDHCKDILQKLLDLGRIEEMDIATFDLRQCVQSALETIQPQLSSGHIPLSIQGLDIPATLQGDTILVTEAIVAVLQNAVEAMPQGGELRVSLIQRKRRRWWTPKRPEDMGIELRIEDTGVGIPASQLETIFRPFFTTKSGHGSGLGLSAALRIMDKHGGSISVKSAGAGQGACFILLFPTSYHPQPTPVFIPDSLKN